MSHRPSASRVLVEPLGTAGTCAVTVSRSESASIAAASATATPPVQKGRLMSILIITDVGTLVSQGLEFNETAVARERQRDYDADTRCCDRRKNKTSPDKIVPGDGGAGNRL